MSRNWKPNPKAWKKDPAKQYKRTESIARQCYKNRLRLDKNGDAETDWVTAEKISQNPVRKLLFSSNCLWIKFKPFIPVSLLFSAVAVCFTWWLDHQAEVRQQTTSQNLNHQRIFESYMANLKEISLSSDYKDTVQVIEERTFIRGMTLPVLRELTHDEERKAQLVLLLYQMQMCEILSEEKCKELEALENQLASDNQQPAAAQAGGKNTNQRAEKLLRTADLKFANFRGYKLPNISFLRADLRGVNFDSADLENADLTSADLSCHPRAIQAWWSWIPIFVEDAEETVCANLKAAKLQGANLSNANLQGANLSGIDLSDANRPSVDDAGTEPNNTTNLNFTALLKKFRGEQSQSEQSKDFPGANLTDANLTGADLTDADLTGADLTGADLTGADLTGARLSKAILLGTDLRQTLRLTADQLDSDSPPLFCNVALPEALNTYAGPGTQDCETIIDTLLKRYPNRFLDEQEAAALVEQQRTKVWE